MGVKDATIRMRGLNGQWSTLGVDIARGIYAEGLTLTSDLWGSKTATFELRRDADRSWPDLFAFTPIDIEIGGKLVWSGRTIGAPKRRGEEDVISISCEGWQAHLDDDMFEKKWVHTDLGQYINARQQPGSTITTYPAYGTVESKDGSLVLSYPQGTTVLNTKKVAAFIDLGENCTATRLLVTYESLNNSGNGNQLLALDSWDASNITSGTAVNNVNVGVGASSGILAGTDASPARYWTIALYSSAGADFVATGEFTVRITSIMAFASTTYESGNASVLKAHHVVTDAITLGTTQLSSDLSGINTGGSWFSIPEFAPDGARTPRALWEAADVFEDGYKKIDVLKRAVYKPRPTAPVVEVGAWSAAEFEDGGSDDGSDVFTNVIVTGRDPAGRPIRRERTQAVSTVASRQGLTRTQQLDVSFTITTTAADQIGDKWLASHVKAPFRGTVTAVGRDSFRQVIGGSPLEPEDMLAQTGELLRFNDLIDPDTGDLGRDGRIVEVTYNHDENSVIVTIDSSRTSFESLLERIGIYVNQLRS